MKIAIVRLSALGDIVQSQIVVQFIKKHHPKSQIHWFCDQVFEDVLKCNPLIDKVVPLGLKDLKKNFTFSKFFALKKELKGYGDYDYIIDLQGLIKSAIIGRALGKNLYGFDKNSLRESLASYFYKKGFSIAYEENVIIRYTKLVGEVLGFNITKKEIEEKEKILYYKKSHVDKYINSQKKNVVFIMGASWDSKIYPPNKMGKIAVALDNCNVIALWGNEKEESLADEFLKDVPWGIKCEKLELNSLMALIDKADLVIGGDTGPTHIGWGLNTPTITIFGSTPSFRNSFTSFDSYVVDTGVRVDPNNLKKDDFSITTIDEEEIITIGKDILER